jgi:hypothetical protein
LPQLWKDRWWTCSTRPFYSHEWDDYTSFIL